VSDLPKAIIKISLRPPTKIPRLRASFKVTRCKSFLESRNRVSCVRIIHRGSLFVNQSRTLGLSLRWRSQIIVRAAIMAPYRNSSIRLQVYKDFYCWADSCSDMCWYIAAYSLLRSSAGTIGGSLRFMVRASPGHLKLHDPQPMHFS